MTEIIENGVVQPKQESLWPAFALVGGLFAFLAIGAARAKERNPKRRHNPVHPQALESLHRYKEDLKAGHSKAAEYWRGQAGAYFTANPTSVWYHGTDSKSAKLILKNGLLPSMFSKGLIFLAASPRYAHRWGETVLEVTFPKKYTKRTFKDLDEPYEVSTNRSISPENITIYRGKDVNPIRQTTQGWFWGSRGPFTTRDKALQVARAAYSSGYRGRNPLNISWDNLHPLTRKELAISAGFPPKIASKTWLELDEWIKQEIIYSIKERLGGKVVISSNPLSTFASALLTGTGVGLGFGAAKAITNGLVRSRSK